MNQLEMTIWQFQEGFGQSETPGGRAAYSTATQYSEALHAGWSIYPNKSLQNIHAKKNKSIITK